MGSLVVPMNKIYLQSFFSEPLGEPYSVARFQPQGYNCIKLPMFEPIYLDKTAIKTKDPKQFLESYCRALLRNFYQIVFWCKYLSEDTSLLCWCNEDRNNRTDDKLFCHTIILGYFLEHISKKLSFDIEIVYCDGRDNPVWSREDFLQCIQAITKDL
jgi:hypothetical protein